MDRDCSYSLRKSSQSHLEHLFIFRHKKVSEATALSMLNRGAIVEMNRIVGSFKEIYPEDSTALFSKIWGPGKPVFAKFPVYIAGNSFHFFNKELLLNSSVAFNALDVGAATTSKLMFLFKMGISKKVELTDEQKIFKSSLESLKEELRGEYPSLDYYNKCASMIKIFLNKNEIKKYNKLLFRVNNEIASRRQILNLEPEFISRLDVASFEQMKLKHGIYFDNENNIRHSLWNLETIYESCDQLKVMKDRGIQKLEPYRDKINIISNIVNYLINNEEGFILQEKLRKLRKEEELLRQLPTTELWSKLIDLDERYVLCDPMGDLEDWIFEEDNKVQIIKAYKEFFNTSANKKRLTEWSKDLSLFKEYLVDEVRKYEFSAKVNYEKAIERTSYAGHTLRISEVISILNTVRYLGGRYGRTSLAKILSGDDNNFSFFKECPELGGLSGYTKEECKNIINSLLSKEYLYRQPKRVMLTSFGARMLVALQDNTENLVVNDMEYERFIELVKELSLKEEEVLEYFRYNFDKQSIMFYQKVILSIKEDESLIPKLEKAIMEVSDDAKVLPVVRFMALRSQGEVKELMERILSSKVIVEEPVVKSVKEIRTKTENEIEVGEVVDVY